MSHHSTLLYPCTVTSDFRFKCGLNSERLPLLAISGCGGGSGVSNTPPPPPPPTLSLTFAPYAPAMTPGSSLSVFVTATQPIASLTPSFTLGPLPSGITSPTAFPLSVPLSGASFNLTADSKLALGSYSPPIKVTVGSASSSSVLALTVVQAVGSIGCAIPLFSEVQVVPGGSGTFTSQTVNASPTHVEMALSVSGLPSGITATIQPNFLLAGQSGTVTLSAASNAPAGQNVKLTLTGTPTLSIPTSNLPFLLDVLPSLASALSIL